MAIVIMGLNITKVVSQHSPAFRKLLTSETNTFLPALGLKRGIVSKAARDPDYKRKPPFPYKEKTYTVWHRLIENTGSRFDENSKIIVVDGAVGAGKSFFCKQLAEDLDMLYIPEASMDEIYINPYGYDMRQLNPQMPDSLKSIDIKDVCENPYHLNTAYLQLMLYKIKFGNYIDAIAHIMNTGQGVVMDKSLYSDFVYIEALAKEGFISKVARDVYYDIKRHTIDELLRPHLVIYLDMPVEKIQEKVKERGRPYEVNSKLNSTSFLSKLEDSYKRQYLKEISGHAELLIYDWSDGGDAEVVVEDIERIDFDKYTVYDEKLKDWRFHSEEQLSDYRKAFTDNKRFLMTYFNVPRYDCRELIASGNDIEQWTEVWYNAPGMKYKKGYNADLGDKGVLWGWGAKEKFSWF